MIPSSIPTASPMIQPVSHELGGAAPACMCKTKYRIVGYFRGVYISREHSQSSKIKIVEKKFNVEEAWFSISIREITFRKQELNWL